MLIIGWHYLQHSWFILSLWKLSMKAKFATSCDSCGDKIQPGKEIAKNKDENWVHKHCVEDSEGLP